jgi:poly(hydroxyalkanoate) depolymerase family esterase
MWQQYSYDGPAGSRSYFVYTPLKYQVGVAVPLVVMLHGCTQTASDFATGTQMNEVAEEHNFIVVYPEQARTYNKLGCWNWYNPAHQFRGSGEPAIIAGIVLSMQQNSSQWTIDARRIYVAGLSAGAAMAVILGVTYADLFAAIGVHTGFEYQATMAAKSFLKTSRRGGPNPVQQGQAAYAVMGSYARVVPTIVFHGTGDYTVNSINGEQVVRQWMQTNMLASHDSYMANFNLPSSTTHDQVPGGRSYTVCTWNDSRGKRIQEYWKIDKMGHAWSGGHSQASYTDPLGPNASLAIYQFFQHHRMSWEEGQVTPLLKNLLRNFRDLFRPKQESSK